MKKMKLLMTLVLAMVISVSINDTTVKAASYEYWTSRGVKYIAYLKNTIEWSADSNKIKDVDKRQSVSGLFIQKGGIKKVKSKSTETKYVYNCVTTMLAGATIKGVTLGYTTSWEDRITIKRNGDASVDWDD